MEILNGVFPKRRHYIDSRKCSVLSKNWRRSLRRTWCKPADYVLAQIRVIWPRPFGTETKSKDLLGAISIELNDPDLRPFSSSVFVGALQDKVREHPLVETISFRGWRSGPGGDALDVQFYGASAETLKGAAEDLKTALNRFAAVSAVEDDLAYDKGLILELTAQGEMRL